MAMFHPEMATTCVNPAAAKLSATSGAIPARTPSRIPAPSAASGSGTMSSRPPSSQRRADAGMATSGLSLWPTMVASNARAIAPIPWRARYSR